MNRVALLVAILCLLATTVLAKTKHQKMFEDLYVKSEADLLRDDFIGIYAPLVHRNILGSFLIPGPHQEASWTNKDPFILNNPQLVNLALGLEKNIIARQIIEEVEKRRPRGYDNYPEYAAQHYPLPKEGDEDWVDTSQMMIPRTWIEHQFLKITVLNRVNSEATADFRGLPAMSICVLNRNEGCFDVLVDNGYKPALTSNHSYIVEPVILSAQLNAWEMIPKLVDIGGAFDPQDRGHILTQSNPYFTACTQGHVEYVQQMLRMGQDIDQQHGEEGDTCLHVAAMSGFLPLAAMLIEKGADITITNGKDGQSAYSLSVQHHHRHVQALLADAFLKQRLPLPRPPTIRQRMNDMARHEDIHKYLLGYMHRTNKTMEDLQLEMQNDIAPYDPYYDFDGTYDPTAPLGNVEPNGLPSDHLENSQSGGFLIELDGIFYKAGTLAYKAKMAEYVEKEKEAKRLAEQRRLTEHDELLSFVETQLTHIQKAQEFAVESERSKPAHILEKERADRLEKGILPSDPRMATPTSLDAMSSTQLYSEYQKWEHKRANEHAHDEL